MQKYVYCISSGSHLGTYKIDFTSENPLEICKNANKFGHLYPYTLEFAKHIMVDDETLEGLRLCLMRHHGSRARPNSWFWTIPKDAIKEIFMLIPGTWYDENAPVIEEKKDPSSSMAQPSPDYESESDDESDCGTAVRMVVVPPTMRTNPKRSPCGKYSRSMWEVIPDGSRVRHGGSISSYWIGSYSYSTDTITCDGKVYYSPSGFSKAHYTATMLPLRKPRSNGWDQCEYEKTPGEWIKLSYHRVA